MDYIQQYMNKNPEFHEVIPFNKPIKLYFDIES